MDVSTKENGLWKRRHCAWEVSEYPISVTSVWGVELGLCASACGNGAADGYLRRGVWKFVFGDVGVGISAGYAPVDYRFRNGPTGASHQQNLFVPPTRAEIHPLESLELSSLGDVVSE